MPTPAARTTLMASATTSGPMPSPPMRPTRWGTKPSLGSLAEKAEKKNRPHCGRSEAHAGERRVLRDYGDGASGHDPTSVNEGVAFVNSGARVVFLHGSDALVEGRLRATAGRVRRPDRPRPGGARGRKRA